MYIIYLCTIFHKLICLNTLLLPFFSPRLGQVVSVSAMAALGGEVSASMSFKAAASWQDMQWIPTWG